LQADLTILSEDVLEGQQVSDSTPCTTQFFICHEDSCCCEPKHLPVCSIKIPVILIFYPFLNFQNSHDAGSTKTSTFDWLMFSNLGYKKQLHGESRGLPTMMIILQRAGFAGSSMFILKMFRLKHQPFSRNL
jgi:hypothetical protein